MAVNFADLTVGDVVAETSLQLTRDSLVRYAGASGDFNPIHYRDDVAAEVGLPGVLAHGMLTMGVTSAAVTDWLGASGVVLDAQARFTRPVVVDPQIGAELTVRLTVSKLDAEAGTAEIKADTLFEERTVLNKALFVVQFLEHRAAV